jgi:hypothetical protein
VTSDFDGASFESDVDDPEALRRAEDAVAGRAGASARTGGPGAARIDEAWTTIAAQVVPGQSAGLEDVVRALESEGVDFGWDPYDPSDSVNFLPPQATGSVRKLFMVMVPESQVGKAREVLYGEAPQGVRYMWQATSAEAAGSGPATGSTDEFDFAPSRSAAGPKTREGKALSDNERMARMAGGGDAMAPPSPGAGTPGASAVLNRLVGCLIGAGVLVAVLGILAAVLAAVFLSR